MLPLFISTLKNQKRNNNTFESTWIWDLDYLEHLELWNWTKVTAILAEFKLDKSPVLKTKADMRKAVFFIKQYGGLFSEYEGDFGETDLIQHDIQTGQNQPVKQKARPMNPPQAKDFEKQLRIWLDST